MSGNFPGDSHWNRGLRNTDKSELHELFPLPSLSIPTRGTNMGVILRFKTFYLKIYDHNQEDAYRIQGFRYNEQNPVFEDIVLQWELRTFASRFTKEDYLIGFQEPCDDPNCLVLNRNLQLRYQ